MLREGYLWKSKEIPGSTCLVRTDFGSPCQKIPLVIIGTGGASLMSEANGASQPCFAGLLQMKLPIEVNYSSVQT